MNHEDIVFYTYVSDNYYEAVGTPKLVNSFKKFHPDIRFHVFRQAEVDAVWRKNPGLTWDTAKAAFARELYNDYKLVVQMDSDQMVTGELTEIIKGDYDLGSVMNNNEYDPKATLSWFVPWQNYVNAGLIACTKKEFWDVYAAVCRVYGEMTGFKEQDVLNTLLWSGAYKYRVFDALDQTTHYGTSSRGQWTKMHMEGDKIMLHDKQVKVIHQAGGHSLPKMSLNDGDFAPDVLKRLRELAA